MCHYIFRAFYSEILTLMSLYLIICISVEICMDKICGQCNRLSLLLQDIPNSYRVSTIIRSSLFDKCIWYFDCMSDMYYISNSLPSWYIAVHIVLDLYQCGYFFLFEEYDYLSGIFLLSTIFWFSQLIGWIYQL